METGATCPSRSREVRGVHANMSRGTPDAKPPTLVAQGSLESLRAGNKLRSLKAAFGEDTETPTRGPKPVASLAPTQAALAQAEAHAAAKKAAAAEAKAKADADLRAATEAKEAALEAKQRLRRLSDSNKRNSMERRLSSPKLASPKLRTSIVDVSDGPIPPSSPGYLASTGKLKNLKGVFDGPAAPSAAPAAPTRVVAALKPAPAAPPTTAPPPAPAPPPPPAPPAAPDVRTTSIGASPAKAGALSLKERMAKLQAEQEQDAASSRRSATSSDGGGERRLSFKGLGDVGSSGGLSKITNSYQQALEADADKAPPKLKKRESYDGIDMSGAKGDFERKMAADNASRGVGSRPASGTGGSADLQATLAQVEASDGAMSKLDLSESAQFGWLSQPQKLLALERIARGCGLTSLVLNSVKLDNSHAPALAAAARSHSSLEKLSLESNSLGEPALVALAAACEAHPTLTWLSVAHQKTGALTQPAIIALIGAMEGTPRMTKLQLGSVSDPTLRKRLEAASMHNLELARRRRVAEGVEYTRDAAQKAHDWGREARRLASSESFEYGVSNAASRPSSERLSSSSRQSAESVEDQGDAVQKQYVLTDNVLWRVATDSERLAVLSALGHNSVITSFEAVNAFINDPLAVALGSVLSTNSTLTTLNIESNSISSRGVEAIGLALPSNGTLRELKMANQHVSFSQSAERVFSDGLDGNTTLLHLTIDLRSLQAREHINRSLTRNHELQRAQRLAAGITAEAPQGGFKPADWQREIAALAASAEFEFGVADSCRVDQEAYIVRGNALWSRATEGERDGVLAALATNTVVRELDLWNSYVNDALAGTLSEVLAKNGTITALNLESNVIRSTGIESIAAGLARNTSLRTLKMANLHAPGSNQVVMLKADVEMLLANAVDVHPHLLKLTVDLRHVPAKDVVRRALERNNERERVKPARRNSAWNQAGQGK